jgi:hypothetical protein
MPRENKLANDPEFHAEVAAGDYSPEFHAEVAAGGALNPAQACALVPRKGRQRLSIIAMTRWIRQGSGGVKLESHRRRTGDWYTTAGAIARYQAASKAGLQAAALARKQELARLLEQAAGLPPGDFFTTPDFLAEVAAGAAISLQKAISFFPVLRGKGTGKSRISPSAWERSQIRNITRMIERGIVGVRLEHDRDPKTRELYTTLGALQRFHTALAGARRHGKDLRRAAKAAEKDAEKDANLAKPAEDLPNPEA